jgi:hypothetical protein
MNKAQGPRRLPGDALLREVIAHITRPERAYFNKWVQREDGAVGELAAFALRHRHAGSLLLQHPCSELSGRPNPEALFVAASL